MFGNLCKDLMPGLRFFGFRVMAQSLTPPGGPGPAGIMLYERALRHLTLLERPLAATGDAFIPRGVVQADKPTQQEIEKALGKCQTDERRAAAWGELLDAKDRQAYQRAYEGNYSRAVDSLMAAKFTYVVASQVGQPAQAT